MDSSIIFKYFPNLSGTQKDQFSALGHLYDQWNQKINVISRKDMDGFYERHVLHSLSIAKFVLLSPRTRLLDVGTGGGFPGIPLAIFFPEAQFHLVDSVGKKINVVTAISDNLGLKNITAEHTRMEQLKGEYDFVVSRAVARAEQLVDWTKHLISQNSQNEVANGWLLLKGGDLEKEMRSTRQPYRINVLSDYFKEDFFGTKKVVHSVPKGVLYFSVVISILFFNI